MKKSDYSENWKDEIRPAILKRDSYKCQVCHIRHRSIGYYNLNKVFVDCDNFMVDYCNRNSIKVIKIFLQVHHKDGNKLNNDPVNLQTLCNRCHLATERELNKLKRLTRGIIYPKK